MKKGRSRKQDSLEADEAKQKGVGEAVNDHGRGPFEPLPLCSVVAL